MSREIKERLKTVCIYILILTGLIQIGILWNYENQGAPISFFTGLFSKDNQISDEAVSKKLFAPYRLILSDGEITYWIISRDSEYYRAFWNEAVNGLEKIVSGEAKLAESNENWTDIIDKQGLMVDFGYTMDYDLLRWFLDTGRTLQEVPAFRKFMIKRDIVRNDTGVFYIFGSDGKIYSSDPIRFEKAANISDICIKLIDDQADTYRRYFTLSGSKINKPGDEPDTLYVASSPRYWPYFRYTVKPPERAENELLLAESLLGSEAGRYNKYVYNEDVIQYTYGSNIYRYYSDGYMTYRYLGSNESSSGNKTGEALMTAYKFVARVRELLDSDTEIILSSVKKKSGGEYEFGFDYRIDGMPVKVDYEMKDGSGKRLGHAIRITADNKRVLECDWLLLDFRQNGKGSYNDRLLEVIGSRNIKFDDITVKQIDTGYYISNSTDGLLEPSMIIKTDKKTVSLELIPQKGD